MEINGFRVKAYGFYELAQVYNPGVTAETAAKRLRTWIQVNQSLKRELTARGWQKGTRLLTPLQVKTIVHYIGEP